MINVNTFCNIDLQRLLIDPNFLGIENKFLIDIHIFSKDSNTLGRCNSIILLILLIYLLKL